MGRKDVIRPCVSDQQPGRCTDLYFFMNREILSASYQGFPCRQWLKSQISMVTFDQRSASSLISRLITNRVEHIGSPLILAGGKNADMGERKRKGGKETQREGVGCGTASSLSARSYF